MRNRTLHLKRRLLHIFLPMKISMQSDWWTEDSYLPWIDPLVQNVFGQEINLHWDIYLQTHAHRLQHGDKCTAYPSPPSRAPLWSILSDLLAASPAIIVETGTALGYSSLLIAEAFPDAHVFTVENDPLHQQIAAQIFSKTDTRNRITIVPTIVEAPIERSDILFIDGPTVDPDMAPPHCLLINDTMKRSFRLGAISALQPLRKPSENPRLALKDARERYRNAVKKIVAYSNQNR